MRSWPFSSSFREPFLYAAVANPLWCIVAVGGKCIFSSKHVFGLDSLTEQPGKEESFHKHTLRDELYGSDDDGLCFVLRWQRGVVFVLRQAFFKAHLTMDAWPPPNHGCRAQTQTLAGCALHASLLRHFA